MLVKLLTLLIAASANSGTQLMQDPLNGDHAPRVVLDAITGNSSEYKQPEKRLAKTNIQKGEDEPIHVEQMIGYRDQLVKEGDQGFLAQRMVEKYTK